MHLSKILFSAVLLLLVGCNQKELIEGFGDGTKKEIANRYIELLILKDFDTLEAELSPEIKEDNKRETLVQMSDLFPESDPVNKELIGYRFAKGFNKNSVYQLSYQYAYENLWLVIYIAFQETSDGETQLLTIRVSDLDKSLEETHKFTLSEKTGVHYLFLFFCILNPLFIVVTFISCIRTRIRKSKWLWLIVILLGVTNFSLNWSTGAIGSSLIHIQLLGAGAISAGPYSPWILKFSIPAGAIVYWFKRRSLVREPSPPKLPPREPQAGTASERQAP